MRKLTKTNLPTFFLVDVLWEYISSVMSSKKLFWAWRLERKIVKAILAGIFGRKEEYLWCPLKRCFGLVGSCEKKLKKITRNILKRRPKFLMSSEKMFWARRQFPGRLASLILLFFIVSLNLLLWQVEIFSWRFLSEWRKKDCCKNFPYQIFCGNFKSNSGQKIVPLLWSKWTFWLEWHKIVKTSHLSDAILCWFSSIRLT